MKTFYGILIYFAFIAVPCSVFASSVVINEIAWMGSSPQNGETASVAANNEWIELKNTGTSSVNLDGWSLSAEDGTPSIALTGSISAGGFFLLERTNDDTVLGITADAIYTGALSNSGEKLILKNGQGAVIDMVDASSGWPAGSTETKETMQKGEGGWITAPATPHGGNVISQPPSPLPLPSNTPTPSPSSSSFSPAFSATPYVPPIKTIKAYAGEDISSMVGVTLEFLGHAKGINDEVINSSVRFFWNFGDGETQEGRSVVHSYRLPGMYLASLYVSTGEYTASDYIRVHIDPNKVTISGVVLGQDGYMRLTNTSNIEVDISGWNMKDSQGHAFVIPPHTRMAGRGDIAMLNHVTGLLLTSASLPFSVWYANGVLALTYTGANDEVVLSKNNNEDKSKKEIKISPVETKKINPNKQEEQNIHRSIISASVSASPSFSPILDDEKDYASVSPAPFVSLPFGIAIGVSILGAVGFLISKHVL